MEDLTNLSWYKNGFLSIIWNLTGNNLQKTRYKKPFLDLKGAEIF